MVVILHNIRSLHNVGSIFRTADAVGTQKLYLGGITPGPVDRFGKLEPKFAKVALGAEKSVTWEKVAQTSQVIKSLKQEGYKIFTIEQSRRSIQYYSLPTTHYKLAKVALVLGAEVEGLPANILAKCDKILEIPMLGGKESLNVSVAFGIVAFHLRYGHTRKTSR